MSQSATRYAESHLYRIRHSLAHILAEAVLEKFPDARIAIGPPIEDGFYYDFEFSTPPTDDDLKQIEARMKKIISGNHAFTMREVTADEARQLFANQPYKLELIDDLVNGRVDEDGEQIAAPSATLTVYTQNTFTDLCKGPHVSNTQEINPNAFSITFRPMAGAYWRGDEKRTQLTRIYGTAWQTPDELKDYLHRLEEARKRDHRVLGQQLELFLIEPLVGKGLSLWLPNGATLRDTLERWLRQKLLDAGYQPVVTPHIGSIELYKTSGHYPYYKDNQFPPMDVDGEEYMMKPMNCPHHIMIYRSSPRSYRDLPLRYAEFGTVYRYEKSGQLHGLTRVRGFTQDDAHMFVTPEQLEDEFISVVRLAQEVFNELGMNEFRARVGIRDSKKLDKYAGDDSLWIPAANAIINACEKIGIPFTVEEGEAAFYGPKLDLVFRDVLKRDWQLGTVQVDPNLPQRFDLEYTDSDGQRKRPIMIHRALFGSVERFVGILIEHFGGAFPAWLAPLQAVIIPIREDHNAYAQEVAAHLRRHGLRVKADLRDKHMRNKIKENRALLIPWLLIVGDRDVAERTVSVRLRTDEDKGALSLDDFTALATRLVAERALNIF
ncbi:MAG: threonine--tRNA ligase [Anaerolineae bacterium]|nr:threonine--tRNA ligase [Anaerolineae bacterium]MDW8173562.1 threonine--tRNA ligase [Anaerolineae bacterium]